MDELTLARLMDLEHDGWKALTQSTGGDFYGELMTADAVMVLVNGMVLDRDSIVRSLNDSPPWATYELTGERRVGIASDAAAVVYRASATRDGQAEPFVALMSSVYRLVDGRARLVLYQQTTITH